MIASASPSTFTTTDPRGKAPNLVAGANAAAELTSERRIITAEVFIVAVGGV